MLRWLTRVSLRLRCGCRHLESGLRNVEVRTGRYGKRKKISSAGVVKMMNLLGNRKHIVREEFRDLLIMLPSKELVTVTPYYMKVRARGRAASLEGDADSALRGEWDAERLPPRRWGPAGHAAVS